MKTIIREMVETIKQLFAQKQQMQELSLIHISEPTRP